MRAWVLATATATGFALLLAGCATPQGEPAPVRPGGGQTRAADVNPPARTTADRISKACGELAEQLSAKLPAEKKVAVLPLVDAHGGVTRLGVVMAEGICSALSKRGKALVDRGHLNRLLSEIKIQQALAGDPGALGSVGQISGAGVLVVGRVVDAGKEVLASAKALSVTPKAGTVRGQTELVSLPREGLERLMWYVRRPTAAAQARDLPPLALRYEFVSPGVGGEARLGEGSTVRNGQKFKIRVQPNSDCCLYVLLYDSSDQASVLFPHRKIGMSNEVRGGVSYEIPEATKWYWFDNRPGTETFYLVASYTPLDGLREILAKMEQAGGQKVQLAREARERIEKVITRGLSAETSKDYCPKGYTVGALRGVGGVVDVGGAGSATTDTHGIDAVVEGHATVVKKLTLTHR